MLDRLERQVIAEHTLSGPGVIVDALAAARVSFLARLAEEGERMDPEQMDLMIALGLR